MYLTGGPRIRPRDHAGVVWRIDRVFATSVTTIRAVVEESTHTRALIEVTPGSAEEAVPRLRGALGAAAGVTGSSGSGGLPGLRRELFPAAAWRRELEAIRDAERAAAELRRRREEARVAHSLAHLRAEEILKEARVQARRLVRTASAVAKARREQARREAEETIAAAGRVASEIIGRAEEDAAGRTAEPPLDATELHGKLLRLHGALQDAETRLEAYTQATREDLDDVIDLDAIEVDEADEAPVPAADDAAGPDDGGVPVAAAPRIRPKSRFQIPGLTPDRIEALREQLAP